MAFYTSGIVCVFCNTSMVDRVLNKTSTGLCSELLNLTAHSINKWTSVGWCSIPEMFAILRSPLWRCLNSVLISNNEEVRVAGLVTSLSSSPQSKITVQRSQWLPQAPGIKIFLSIAIRFSLHFTLLAHLSLVRRLPLTLW